MKLIYSSSEGELVLEGGGGNHFNIVNIEGIGLPEKVRSLQSFTAVDGCFEKSAQYAQRIITVSGDVRHEENDLSVIKNAVKVLSQNGVLVIENGNTTRKINVNSASLTIGKRYGVYTAYVIQLVCDYPHFSDMEQVSQNIFARIKMLNSTAQFPMMFSQRISEGNVINSGNVRTYPLITIKKIAPDAGANTITVINNTTGKSLVFEKNLDLNEIVEIDTENRTVESNIYKNVIGTLDSAYSLADMYLETGTNNISVSVDGINRGIEVKVSFSNKYTEAL